MSYDNLPVSIPKEIHPRIKLIRVMRHLPRENTVLLFTFYNGYKLSFVRGPVTNNFYELSIMKGRKTLQSDDGDNIFKTKSRQDVIDTIRRISLHR